MNRIPLLSAALAFAAVSFAGAQSFPYERLSQDHGRPVAETQYAILHALLGWRGGSSPTFNYYEAKDKKILAELGLDLKELTAPPERSLLEVSLGKVRHDRNGGVRNIYNRGTFI